jgi:hypothetical protein
VVGGLAGGALAAHVRVGFEAGIAALEGDARLVARAVVVLGAFRVAPGKRRLFETKYVNIQHKNVQRLY